MQPVSVTTLSPSKTRQALYNFLSDFDDYTHRMTSIKLHRYEPNDPAISHIIKTVLHYNVSSTLVIAQHIYYKDGTSKKYGYTYSSYAWVLHSRVYQKWLTLSDYTEYKNGKRHGVSYRVCRENCLKSVETLYRHGKKICALRYNSRGATRYLKDPEVNIVDNRNTVELTKFVGDTEFTKIYRLGKVAHAFFLNNREIDTGEYVFIQCIMQQGDWYNLMPYDSLESKSNRLHSEKSVRHTNCDKGYIFSVTHDIQSTHIRMQYYQKDSENGQNEYTRKIWMSTRTGKYTIQVDYEDCIESELELTATDNTIPEPQLNDGTITLVRRIKIMNSGYIEEPIMKYNAADDANLSLGMDSKLYPGAPDLLTALGPGFDISSIDDSIVDFLKLQYA